MRIAIIGAGIGGLTAALALRQFGFEPQVFEQAPALLDVGAAILMWPNAMRVLHQLGLADAVRQHGGIMEQARWLNYDGRLLNNFRFPKTDIPPVALHRAELQHVLLNALSENSIQLDHVFQSYEQRAGEIVARFAEGRSFECEALIGADGLHSRVRTQLLNDGPPTEHDYVAWRGVVNSPAPSITPGIAYEIYGRGQRFGIGTLGSGKIGWWASINKTLSESSASSASKKANEHEGHELYRDELLRCFDGWWAPVPELIRATPASALIRNVTCDRRPSRKWGEGPMTLLGDAVHPLTPNLGQGGCLAIEDAAILARCLNKYGSADKQGGVTSALRKFEALRFARTATIARYSRMYGVVGQWETSWAVRLRRVALSLVPAALTRRLLSWLFVYDAYGVSI